RTDVPVRLGLAVLPGIVEEERLRRYHMILQAMDRLSLAICWTKPPFPQIENIVPREGARAITMNFIRTGDWSIRVDPWPFDVPEIHLSIGMLRLAAVTYLPEQFVAAFAAAERIEAQLRIHKESI